MQKLLILAGVLLLAACGLSPHNPYTKVETLQSRALIRDSDDIYALAESMAREMQAFPPLHALAKDGKINISVSAIHNNTKYLFDEALFQENLITTLGESGELKITDNNHAFYHLIPEFQQKEGHFIFSLSLRNEKTGLLLWHNEIQLKMKN